MTRALVAAGLLAALAGVLLLPLRAKAQPITSDGRFASLQWRFVRIKYHYDANLLRAEGNDIYGESMPHGSP